jgi:hypothetical protein
VDLVETIDIPCSPNRLFPFVSDLERFPMWLSIVAEAVRINDIDDETGTGRIDNAAWSVELRGKVGPFARSKRLRMVCVSLVPDTSVVFERDERDGRNHAMWRLSASIAPTSTGSRLIMHLGYNGALFGPVMERLLSDEIATAKQRLIQVAQAA